MVYQVKLEKIRTVMNFFCIVQGELSFMFVQGVTTLFCASWIEGEIWIF